MKFKAHDTGLVLGLLFAGLHTVWALMVFMGVAQMYLNWIFELHSIINPYQVLPFDLQRSVILIVVTFVVGYLCGYVFATIWNRIVKK